MKSMPFTTLHSWEGLRNFLNHLSLDQLKQLPMAIGDTPPIQILGVEVFAEDQINPSGDGIEPVSAYDPEDDDHDVVFKAGTPMLYFTREGKNAKPVPAVMPSEDTRVMWRLQHMISTVPGVPVEAWKMGDNCFYCFQPGTITGVMADGRVTQVTCDGTNTSHHDLRPELFRPYTLIRSTAIKFAAHLANFQIYPMANLPDVKQWLKFYWIECTRFWVYSIGGVCHCAEAEAYEERVHTMITEAFGDLVRISNHQRFDLWITRQSATQPDEAIQ